MKKCLMAMAFAAAVAPAFATEQTGTNYWGSINFESYTNVPVVGVSGKTDTGAPTSGAEVRWWATSQEDSSTVMAYDGSITAPTNNRPDKYASETTNTNYLKLATDGATLWRYFNPTTIVEQTGGASTMSGAAVELNSDVYIDQMVQFTVSEEVGADGPASIDANAKLAIWLEKKDNDSTSTTNLMVKGSYVQCADSGDNLCTTSKIYTLSGTVKPGEWYRLTVRAIRNVCAKEVEGVYLPAFAIYLDGQPLTATEDVMAADAKPICTNDIDDLNCCLIPTNMMAMFNAKQLIPSIVGYNETETSALSAVGYQGTGAIDDLVMTDAIPNFLASVVPVTPGGKTEIIPGTQSQTYDSEEAANSAMANMEIKITDTAAASAGQKDCLKLVVVPTTGTGGSGTSGWCVEVQIDTNKITSVETTLTKVAESMGNLMGASPTDITVDSGSCTKGLYYSIGSMAELGGDVTEGPRVLATDSGVTLTATKPEGATDKCFFKVLVNMTGNSN